ncbi:bifunctional protein HldE, domain I [Blochmannia endosymbiont of Camponotus (Colobopsis) obliquus]|nr:bifunctional protein HldE, domain I [Blochmannia endosymbiont of Camponotus (Colobopsis) obliquus]
MVFIDPNFRQVKILVVGDVMLDRYWRGDIKNISSEMSVPVMQVNAIEEYPGGAANVAMNIATLGSRSKLIGLIGVDEFAKELKRKIVEAHVEHDLIPVINCPTINKLRIISHNQQILRLDFEHYFSKNDALSIFYRVQCILSDFDILVLSDYAKGSLGYIDDIISFARRIGIPILVDPKGSDYSRYRGTTVLTPNLLEFESVVGQCTNECMLIQKGMEILVDYEISALLITRSEQGMILLRLGAKPVYFPSQAKVVCDVIGAGDTVIAVLAVSLSSGNTIEESCLLASFAASVVIGKFGTSTVSSTELCKVMRATR